MPKKLLIITDEMEIGGTQRQIVELVKHIDRSSFSVSLVYFRNGSSYVDELERLGVEVTRIGKRHRLDLLFFARLVKYLRKNRFDIVHAYSFSGELWGWLGNMLAGNARFISSIRSVYEWYSPLQWKLKRWITLGSSALIANSRAGADYAALRMGVRRNMVDVVYNSVALPDSASPEEQTTSATKDGDVRITFVGRLVEHKNLDCLLRAARLLVDKNAKVRFDIVGDGPLRETLHARVEELGIKAYVDFAGERPNVVDYLRRGDIFVMTSYREGLSNAVLEAMSTGMPVVASNVGGNPELVTHDRSGFLFPVDDHETLADMLLELVNDGDKRRRFGEQARAFARRFEDPKRMAADMERIYERSLIEERAFVMGR